MHILHTLLGLLSTEGEFVKQSGASSVSDHFSYSLNPKYLIQKWCCKKKLDGIHL